MKISGKPKEIAAFVLELQKRQRKSVFELLEVKESLMDGFLAERIKAFDTIRQRSNGDSVNSEDHLRFGKRGK